MRYRVVGLTFDPGQLTLVPMLFIMPDFGGAGIVVSNLISKHCLLLMRLVF